jgi:hypothetical protein
VRPPDWLRSRCPRSGCSGRALGGGLGSRRRQRFHHLRPTIRSAVLGKVALAHTGPNRAPSCASWFRTGASCVRNLGSRAWRPAEKGEPTVRDRRV